MICGIQFWDFRINVKSSDIYKRPVSIEFQNPNLALQIGNAEQQAISNIDSLMVLDLQIWVLRKNKSSMSRERR